MTDWTRYFIKNYNELKFVNNDEDERDFRISSNQLQKHYEKHIVFIDDDDELNDLNSNSENDLSKTDSKNDSN